MGHVGSIPEIPAREKLSLQKRKENRHSCWSTQLMTNTTAATDVYQDSVGYARRQPPPIIPVSSTPTSMLLTKRFRCRTRNFEEKDNVEQSKLVA